MKYLRFKEQVAAEWLLICLNLLNLRMEVAGGGMRVGRRAEGGNLQAAWGQDGAGGGVGGEGCFLRLDGVVELEDGEVEPDGSFQTASQARLGRDGVGQAAARGRSSMFRDLPGEFGLWDAEWHENGCSRRAGGGEAGPLFAGKNYPAA